MPSCTPPIPSPIPVSCSPRPSIPSATSVPRSVTEVTTSLISNPKSSERSPRPLRISVCKSVNPSPVVVPRFDIAVRRPSVDKPKLSASSSIPLWTPAMPLVSPSKSSLNCVATCSAVKPAGIPSTIVCTSWIVAEGGIVTAPAICSNWASVNP